MTKSKMKRQTARKQHQIAKYRAKYKRVVKWRSPFEEAISSLLALNDKYVSQFLQDFNHGLISATDLFWREHHEEVVRRVTNHLFERTILK